MPPACSSHACREVLEDEEGERKRGKRRGITEGPTGRDIESCDRCPPVGTLEERERRSQSLFFNPSTTI